MNGNNYYIKEGYICNPAKTFDKEETDQYWSDERLEASRLFQYHVYEYAFKVFNKHKFRTVADVGSGPGIKTIDFFHDKAEKITLFDQPSTEKVIEKRPENVDFIPIDLDNLDGVDIKTKYDIIICADVIEHLKDPDQLLEFLKSISHHQSIIIISTPERDIRRGINNKQSPNEEHVREWNKEELYKYIYSKGFNIEKHFTTQMKKTSNYKRNVFFTIIKLIYSKQLKATQVISCKIYL